MPDRKCLECGDTLHGRSDQKFCSDQCRNAYNNRQLGATNNMIRRINRILKKNQMLLSSANISGKVTVTKEELQQKDFNFNYFTNIYSTRQGRIYYFCYDQGYCMVEGGKVLLVRKQGYIDR